MWVMKNISNRLIAAAFAFAVSVISTSSVQAQESKTLGKGPIVVRLCPTICVAVNVHGLKSGGKVAVYETKSGWMRVSDFLNRFRLVKSFGNLITRKPALWVSASKVVGAAAAAAPTSTPAAKPTAESKLAVGPPKKLATPTFRPGKTFAKVEN